MLVLEYLVGLHITFQLQLFQHYWSGHRIGLLWYWMVCRTDIEDYWKRTEIILLFLRLHPRAAFLTLVDYECYSISSEEVLPPVVDIMVIWVKFAHSNPFSSLIPKMSMFTLAMSCLITFNVPCFMDPTFQVPTQYCSLQQWTILSPIDTSTTECFSSLVQPLHSSWSSFSTLPQEHLHTTDLGGHLLGHLLVAVFGDLSLCAVIFCYCIIL